MNRSAVLGFVFLFVVGPAFGQSFTGEVAEVRDGDTIIILRGAETVTVQLHGLDAPELGQPYGERAANFLRRRIEGDRVRVRVKDWDWHGRLVSSVFHEGNEVNAQLLEAGLAWYYWWYDEYTPDAARDQTREYRALQAGRGLWSQSAPVPPWTWRDADRGSPYGHSGPSGLRYNTEGRPRTCDEFETQAEAQRFFEAALPSVAKLLDRDADGVACERLRSE